MVPVEKVTKKSTITGPMIDRVSWKVASHGTLSKYRDDNQKISISSKTDQLSISINDNFLKITAEGESIQQVAPNVIIELERIIEILSIQRSSAFKVDTVSITDSNNKNYAPNELIQITFTTYDLDELTDHLNYSIESLNVFNDTLDKSAFYYKHALILDKLRSQLLGYGNGHYEYYISAIILNLWKSITTIMGDPAKSKDGYQRKYRDYGLDESFKTKMDSVKNLRDSKDIAHSDIDSQSIANEQIQTTRTTAKIAIEAYIKHLKAESTDVI